MPLDYSPLIDFLRQRKTRKISCDGCSDAAVAIPFVQADKLELLFTKRAGHLARHAGEMSFPGGRVDPSDGSKLDTAMRELSEEIGIDTREVTVIGKLDDARSITNFHIVPYLCVVPYRTSYDFERSEIEEVHPIPLSRFLATPVKELYRKDGVETPNFVYRVNGVTIFGVTAHIVKNLVEILEESGFIAENEKFIR